MCGFSVSHGLVPNRRKHRATRATSRELSRSEEYVKTGGRGVGDAGWVDIRMFLSLRAFNFLFVFLRRVPERVLEPPEWFLNYRYPSVIETLGAVLAGSNELGTPRCGRGQGSGELCRSCAKIRILSCEGNDGYR